MARTSLQALAVSAVVLAGTVTGCGGADETDGSGPRAKSSTTASPSPSPSSSPTLPAFVRGSAGSIVAASLRAMRYLDQVRFSGKVIVDGEKMVMNVRTDIHDNCSGTVTQGQVTTRFIATRTASYVKGNAAFWSQSVGADADQVLAYLHGRWAKGKASKEFARLCNMGILLSSGRYNDSRELVGPNPTVSGIQKFHGHDVVEVGGSAGKERYRFLIEVAEPHRIFRLNSDTPGDPGVLAFDYEDARLVVVPSPKEWVGPAS